MDKPFGGFPKLIQIEVLDKQPKTREFNSIPNTINIKDILKIKQDKKPLFNI